MEIHTSAYVVRGFHNCRQSLRVVHARLMGIVHMLWAGARNQREMEWRLRSEIPSIRDLRSTPVESKKELNIMD